MDSARPRSRMRERPRTSRLVNEAVLERHVLHLVVYTQQGVEGGCRTRSGRRGIHLECAAQEEVAGGIHGGWVQPCAAMWTPAVVCSRLSCVQEKQAFTLSKLQLSHLPTADDSINNNSNKYSSSILTTMFALATRRIALAAPSKRAAVLLAAARPISSSAMLKAAVPVIQGEGAPAGTVPTDEQQATGLERCVCLPGLRPAKMRLADPSPTRINQFAYIHQCNAEWNSWPSYEEKILSTWLPSRCAALDAYPA